MSRLATLVAFGVLVASPAAQAAAPARLAVVELWSPPNLSGIAVKLTQDIVDAAMREKNMKVTGPLEVERALSEDALRSLKACTGRAACVAQWAAPLQVDRVVVGALDRTESTYLVKLFLVDLKSKSVVSSVDRSILIASRRLQSDVAAAIPGLLEGKAEAKGKLTVSTTSPNANMYFDGELVGRTPFTVETKPGKHTLKVTKEGYLPVERFVNVEENRNEQVALMLTKIPGAVVEDDLPVAAKKAEAQGGGFSLPVGTWVAAGAALAAVGVGTYFAVATNDVSNRAGTGPVFNVTRQEAMGARTSALATNICWGVAGAAAAASVLIAVLTPGGDSAPAAAPAPQASIASLPGGAAVSLSGSF